MGWKNQGPIKCRQHIIACKNQDVVIVTKSLKNGGNIDNNGSLEKSGDIVTKALIKGCNMIMKLVTCKN